MHDFEDELERRIRRFSMIDVTPVDADAIARSVLGGRSRWRLGPWTWSGLTGRPARSVALLLGLAGILVAVAVAMPIASRRVDLPAYPGIGRNGSIGFVRLEAEGLPSEIHLMDPDGSHDRIIALGSEFRFSADGSAMAYMGRDGLTVASADGSGAHAITGVPPDRRFLLAPDGAWLLVEGVDGDVASLWRLDLASGARTLLLPDIAAAGYNGAYAAVSPDGRWLAYPVLRPSLERDDAPIYLGPYLAGIDLLRLTTGEIRHLATPVGGVTTVAWSADSRAIAFTAWLDQAPRASAELPGDRATSLVVVTIDGPARILSDEQPACARPAWSPDGSAIACTVDMADEGRVVVVPVAQGDGASRRMVAAGGRPVWSPDGTTLLVASGRAQATSDGGVAYHSEIRLVDPTAAREPQTLAAVDGMVYGRKALDWQWLAP